MSEEMFGREGAGEQVASREGGAPEREVAPGAALQGEEAGPGYVCVHGHFYQPPRENPWTGQVEEEPSAAPFHDWNQRIASECYAPLAAAKILEDSVPGGGKPAPRVVDLYRRISFDFGPTLLAWMERGAPEVLEAVVAADRAGRQRYSGHGPALAQAYGHMILPLASPRDKETQVLWGLADFERRFGRRAEGMWLPETAVDVATLEHLAQAGVEFTVLAPGQARRVRRLPVESGDGEVGGGAAGATPPGRWRDVRGGRVDPGVAYRCELPSGRSIALFFYDGALARGVAFEGLLHDGSRLAEALVAPLQTTETSGPRLSHLATDGETYGHHHRHGEMALAWALERIEREGSAQLTVYGELLERHPPRHQVEIVEPSSWSCPHGVERWRSDCGCQTGGDPSWSQAWRRPLRCAFDRLRDRLAPRYEEELGRYLTDPWAARNAYVRVLLDPSDAGRGRFLERQRARSLSEAEGQRCWRLLEMQRHLMAMYTSCGWFFNDLAGLETVLVMRHAARAAELAAEVFGEDFEGPLMEDLARAESNRPEAGDGAEVYRRGVGEGRSKAVRTFQRS